MLKGRSTMISISAAPITASDDWWSLIIHEANVSTIISSSSCRRRRNPGSGCLQDFSNILEFRIPSSRLDTKLVRVLHVEIDVENVPEDQRSILLEEVRRRPRDETTRGGGVVDGRRSTKEKRKEEVRFRCVVWSSSSRSSPSSYPIQEQDEWSKCHT